MTASPLFFRLAPIPCAADELDHSTLSPASSRKGLEEVEPRFYLPSLDEHASATERLLGSLNGSSSYNKQGSRPSEPLSLTDSAGALAVKPLKADEDDGEPDDIDGIWRRLAEEPEAGPSRRPFQPLRTWDRDEHGLSALDPFEQTPFLSEKGTFALESLLTTLEPPIHLGKLGNAAPAPIPPRDPKELLGLMMRATLGTTSTEHLIWDARKSRYKWAEGGGRLLGVEKATAVSAINSFLDIGTAIRRLELISDSQSALPLTPTHHALLHGLSTYLTFVKQRLTTAVEQSTADDKPSWNKWMSATKDVRALAEALCDVMGWSLSISTAQALPSRASSLLTHLYSHLLAHLSTASPAQQRSPMTLALAYLLSTSSAPFLTLLHRWVGLQDSSELDEDPDPSSQPWADLGITRTPAISASAESDIWEYTFASRRMPAFVPKETRRTLFEAGRSLRLLKDASGGMHPLCSGAWGVETKWAWGEGPKSTVDMRSHARRVRREIEHWRRFVRDRTNSNTNTKSLARSMSFSRLRGSQRKERKKLPLEFRHQSPIASTLARTEVDPPGDDHDANPAASKSELGELWAMFDQAPGSHLAPAPSQKQGKLLWAPTPLDELHTFIARHSDPSRPLLPPDSPTLPLFISTHLLAPLLTHSTLVSTSLISLYFEDLRFIDHLDILRSYWLAGDIGFSERVSDALFGKEAGAGEALGLGRRARTRARLGLAGPYGDAGLEAVGGKGGTRAAAAKGGHAIEGEWGIGLGIGLSERSKWPPGGSELAYALRTTLLEDEGKVERGGSVRRNVNDRVSFAIRELPEEDKGRRARWMDPQAIEALDFLYLSYSPPPAISILLPTSLMEKYQSIHNLLLRLSRVETVLKSMYFDVIHQYESSDKPVKVGIDSGLNRPPSRTSLHERHAHSLFPSGSKDEKMVQRLRFRMSTFVGALVRYVLDVGVGSKWEVMRRRLERLSARSPGNESTGTETDSRPSSPSPSNHDEDELYEQLDEEEIFIDGHEDEEDDGGEQGTWTLASLHLHQLQSIHSLVLYHHLTLDKILRACLLGPQAGQQVTYKVLMTLLGLVLDLGKVLKEIERGVVGWQDGAERVREMQREWEEKEAVFLHALERLSLRTTSRSSTEEEQEVGGNETDQDMRILLKGEGGSQEQLAGGRRSGMGNNNDLQELLLRLKMVEGLESRGGRYDRV